MKKVFCSIALFFVALSPLSAEERKHEVEITRMYKCDSKTVCIYRVRSKETGEEKVVRVKGRYEVGDTIEIWFD